MTGRNKMREGNRIKIKIALQWKKRKKKDDDDDDAAATFERDNFRSIHVSKPAREI